MEFWLQDSRPELSDELVVGVWRGPDGCELTIDGDGTFRASRIPASVFGPTPESNVASGFGTWSVRPAVNDYSERNTQVSLVFERLENYSVPYSINLRSALADNQIVLFWFIGDPDLDRRFVLQKGATG